MTHSVQGGDQSFDNSLTPKTTQTPQTTPQSINPDAPPLPSVPSISSPFRRSRYDHRTRRECLENKGKWQGRQSPSNSQLRPRIKPPEEEYESFRRPQFLRRDEDEEKKSDGSAPQEGDTSNSQSYKDRIRQPLHVTATADDDDIRYYRVVYRGVVALLSEANPMATRSGCYLSYGEVIKSRSQIQIGRKIAAIRVDEIITGGYAYDPANPNQSATSMSQTPKRSNVITGYTTTTSNPTESPATPAASLALSQPAFGDKELEPRKFASVETPRCEQDGVPHQGFVFSQNSRGVALVEPLLKPPQCEYGRFFYKIVSTTPLPILSGPSSDAPLTKAMVLPGTVHEVSFRMKLLNEEDDSSTTTESLWWLRLAKRKGYIASQRLGGAAGKRRSNSEIVKDVTEEINSNNLPGSSEADPNVSVLSLLSASIPFSTARHPRRRHRPPRRTRGAEAPIDRPKQNNKLDTSTLQNLSVQSHSSDRLQTPSSNVSLLSDDSSLTEHRHSNNTSLERGALSPDRSVARSNHSFQQQQAPLHPTFFLMRVTAPRGLRILDAPHFQVNNLIHGSTPGSTSGSISSHHQTDLFHTTRINATTNPADNTVVFDSVSKTRVLPRGAVFEAAKRMETSEAVFHQGAGLIKLADKSGWVIVPHEEELEHQFRSNGQKMDARCKGYEEIGNAIVFSDSKNTSWMRVLARGGVHVACAPPPPPLTEDNDSSHCGSPASSAVEQSSLALAKSESTSDVASSVGSSFLDAMFRGPKRSDVSEDKRGAMDKPAPPSTLVSCGICVQVEPQIPPDHPQHRNGPQEYARLRGRQGWTPLFLGGKPACIVCPRRNPPESRFGSFWFRVQCKRGMKVRLGPSKRAPSIKSGDGVYFRFECGEFLRASEIMKIYFDDSQGRKLTESFAKLYRNRHVRSHDGKGSSDHRLLTSYTTQAEWVQIHDDDRNQQFLQECNANEPPRIERHKQGWRYKVVASAGIAIKKGPSFDAEESGMYIAEGESCAIIERVTCPSENGVTWLRLKEGQGWLHDLDREAGEKLIIPHSFRHRTKATNTRPSKPNRPQGPDDKNQKIAYNTIIARLFHNDLPSDHMPRGPSCQPENMAM